MQQVVTALESLELSVCGRKSGVPSDKTQCVPCAGAAARDMEMDVCGRVEFCLNICCDRFQFPNHKDKSCKQNVDPANN